MRAGGTGNGFESYSGLGVLVIRRAKAMQLLALEFMTVSYYTY